MPRRADTVELEPPGSRPAPGRWRVDRHRSGVTFTGRHLLGAITGRLSDVDGELFLDADERRSAVDIEIGLASADFGSDVWNGLVSAHDLLGVREHPVARYTSTRVRRAGDVARVEGVLDLHGHVAPVPLDVRWLPPARMAPGTVPRQGRGTARFAASARLDRRAFGLRWDLAVVGGDRLVAREVRLDIDLTARLAR